MILANLGRQKHRGAGTGGCYLIARRRKQHTAGLPSQRSFLLSRPCVCHKERVRIGLVRLIVCSLERGSKSTSTRRPLPPPPPLLFRPCQFQPRSARVFFSSHFMFDVSDPSLDAKKENAEKNPAKSCFLQHISARSEKPPTFRGCTETASSRRLCPSGPHSSTYRKSGLHFFSKSIQFIGN